MYTRREKDGALFTHNFFSVSDGLFYFNKTNGIHNNFNNDPFLHGLIIAIF